MTEVMNVANWFLSKESMTHKKLQKLCYYAQAWYCTLLDGTPLFPEEIQAWIHGPVAPALYAIFASQRWEPISKRVFDESAFDPATISVLESVYNTYGRFTGDQLERLTHQEKPWQDARRGLQPWESCTNVISTDSMREYYGERYARGQND